MSECDLCEGTGFVRRGMVITPRFQDDYVDYVVNLVACSHPAPPEGPSEDPVRPMLGGGK